MARADQIPTPGDGVGPDGQFDLNNVSDEFWGELFTRFTPAPFTVVDSPKIQINTAIPYTECIMGEVNKIPAIINVMLECQTPDAGYDIGDMVYAFGVGDRVRPTPNAWIEYNQLRMRFMIANEEFWVNHKTTAVRTNITPENWRLIFRVYC